MGVARDWRWRSTNVFPWCEVVFLPASVLVSVCALLFIVLRAFVLTGLFQIGAATYMAVAGATALGAFATCLTVYFGFPLFWRSIDLAVTAVVGYALAYVDTMWVGNTNALNYVIPAILLAWIFASYAAGVAPRLFPTEVPAWMDHVLQKRIWLQRLHSQVFGATDAAIVGELTRRRVFDILILLLVCVCVAVLYRPIAGLLADDLFFAVGFAVCISGLVSYYALVRQASRQRLFERNENIVTLKNYNTAWILGITIPAVLAISGALLLPPNISPLLKVDWNSAFTHLFDWIAGFLWGSVRKRNLSRSYGAGFEGSGNVGIGISTGGGGPVGSRTDMTGMVPAIAAVIISLLAIYSIYNACKRYRRDIVCEEDDISGEQRDGFWARLFAFLLWPWRVLARWLGRRSRQEEYSDEQDGERARSRSGKSLLRRWIYPQEMSAFIRFVYARLLRQSAEYGYARPASDTAIEFSQSIARMRPEAADAIEDLTQAYCQTRYSKRELDPSLRTWALNTLRKAARYLRRL